MKNLFTKIDSKNDNSQGYELRMFSGQLYQDSGKVFCYCRNVGDIKIIGHGQNIFTFLSMGLALLFIFQNCPIFSQ